MNSKLSPNQYNLLEDTASQWSSLQQCRAYAPRLFNAEGYQTRVKHERELWKYTDSMHLLRFEKNIKKALNGYFTHDEFEVFKSSTERILDFTKNLGKPLLGHNSNSRAFICSRILQQLVLKGMLPQKMNVLELGPGSGSQMAILCDSKFEKNKGDSSLLGNKFMVENTQAFYLCQNHFFSEYFKDNFIESASMPFEEINEILKSLVDDDHRIMHLPWWHFANTDFYLPKIDLVIANHMLSEMSVTAFRHTFNIIFNSNKKIHNCPAPLILCETWGGDPERQPGVMTDFLRIGYAPIHNRPLYKAGDRYLNDLAIGLFADPKFVSQKMGMELIFHEKAKELTPELAKKFDGKRTYEEILNVFIKNNFRTSMLFSTASILSKAILDIRNEKKGSVPYSSIVKYMNSIVADKGLGGIDSIDDRFTRDWGYGTVF